jgi:hypothetical protein
MMDQRDFVTFDADFPDDGQWDEQGNALVPGGRAIAEVIREKLQAHSVPCADLFQHSFYGWAFNAKAENVTVWCLLQAGDDWLLVLDQQKSILARFFGSSNPAGFATVQSKVHEILRSDKRFSNVLWYTKADYENGRKDRARPSP